MSPRFLLDTHILIRWLFEARRLSRNQKRVLQHAAQRDESVGCSAISLLEVAVLVSEGKLIIQDGLEAFFAELQADPFIELLPLTYEVASLAASLRPLKDPFDRAIAATALAHHLQLVTSDQRIVDSGLVPIID